TRFPRRRGPALRPRGRHRGSLLRGRLLPVSPTRMNARQRHRFSSGASRTATNEVQSAHEWRWRVGVEMRLADEEGISPEVRAFIAGQIESVVQLEMLLLLHTDPMRAWSPDELAKELRIEPAW